MQLIKLMTMSAIATALSINSCSASLTADVNKSINNSNVRRGCISVSIKSIENSKIDYKLHDNTPIPPASIQKIVTTIPAIEVLGEDYKFQTKLYKDKSNNYLIKLGADPYLTSDNLKDLTKGMPSEVNQIMIDDSIIDSVEWGEGWQWDDALNPLMPKFSAYNIDNNLLTIILEATSNGAPANIYFKHEYPTTIINGLITNKNINKFKIEEINDEITDAIGITGTIAKTQNLSIPINNPKKYFKLRLIDALLDNEVSNSGVYYSKRLDDTYTLVNTISHNLDNAKIDILKNSNNYVSETVFKLAGGKYKVGISSIDSAKQMFEEYCNRNNLDFSQVNIVDASGVSKNNLMVANFMSQFLLKNKDTLPSLLPTSSEGTLSNRLLYLKNNLRAKTGTLSNISSIAGYITSKSSNKYVFCIMINDSKSDSKDKKLLEDNIIKTIYLKG